MTLPRAARLRLELERVPSAGAIARRAIDAEIDGLLSAETRSSLMLVVSELVNNAVVHGTGRYVDFELMVSADGIRGAVRDDGSSFSGGGHSTGGGFGLPIVNSETRRWGVSTDGGMCVWFEL